ncbi:hypothetical protein [Microbacterium sp. UFMG61]|uniref:hypothetical protein n=1 Tax=Microbacterium sp. UFMG61 TaxID=2745935 RepID=UPI00188E125B|nr:hypothetical protein [Microbacterium sp. UFMG61]
MTSDALIEGRMMLSTIAGLWFGRKVWLPKDPKPADSSWVDGTHRRNIDGITDLYRGRLASERAGIEAVRRRAEFALTAVIAAAGLSASGFERLMAASAFSSLPLLLWLGGLAVEIFAILVFAGVAVSSKSIGEVDVTAYSAMKHGTREELRQYVWATQVTSRTRRAVVTVFRDAFLVALLGLMLFGGAHLAAWMTPVPADPPVVVNVVTP